MKKVKRLSVLLSVLFCLAFPFTACGESDDKGKLDNDDPSKILVAYFSCTHHTEGVAEIIAEITGGTLYEIVPQDPYTADDLNYSDQSTRATEEQHDPTARPKISGSVEEMTEYEVVYLGYPIWWGEAPKIVYTFLEAYDLSDKTIVPFCTSGSSGIGSSAENLHALASGATWLTGKRFSYPASHSDVEAWINSLNG